MRKIPRYAALIAAAVTTAFGAVSAAKADDAYISQNIQGFNLPGVQLPQGADEVRAADGTTCRSAVSGNGAYLDVGVIGTPRSSSTSSNSASAYGRIVIPLGHTPKRLDCTQLYALEVERLRMELRLMQMGLGNQGQPADMTNTASVSGGDVAGMPAGDPAAHAASTGPDESSSGESWADDGWTTKGRK